MSGKVGRPRSSRVRWRAPPDVVSAREQSAKILNVLLGVPRGVAARACIYTAVVIVRSVTQFSALCTLEVLRETIDAMIEDERAREEAEADAAAANVRSTMGETVP